MFELCESTGLGKPTGTRIRYSDSTLPMASPAGMPAGVPYPLTMSLFFFCPAPAPVRPHIVSKRNNTVSKRNNASSLLHRGPYAFSKPLAPFLLALAPWSYYRPCFAEGALPAATTTTATTAVGGAIAAATTRATTTIAIVFENNDDHTANDDNSHSNDNNYGHSHDHDTGNDHSDYNTHNISSNEACAVVLSWSISSCSTGVAPASLASKFNVQDLANTAYATGIQLDVQLFKALASAAEQQVSKPQGLAYTACAFATARFNAEGLANTACAFTTGIPSDAIMLQALAGAPRRQVCEVHPQGLANTAWTSATGTELNELQIEPLASVAEQ